MPDCDQTLPNPLLALHRQAEAELQPYGPRLEIVSTFGEPQAEYAAIHKGCALLDLPQRGVLQLTGKDRLPFLNNLLTNQTWNKTTKTGLAAGQGVYAFYLNTKGRIVADMNVIELGESTLLEMDARLVEPVRAAFDKFLFAERVKMEPRVGALHEVALHGPGALAVLNEAAERPVPELGALNSVESRLFDVQLTIWRDDPAGVPGYHLVCDTADAPKLWNELVARFGQSAELGKRRLRPAGWAAFNAARIEAGRPLFDIDFGNSADPNQSALAAETGLLDRAVSFTKGCYLGQEIVARMHARGQVARQVAGIRFDADTLPIAGAAVYDDQSNAVGAVTSSTVSPMLSGNAICLALLKRPFFTPDTAVNVPAEGAMRKGTVVKLPFV
jgi:folate-binding protein YgfZ